MSIWQVFALSGGSVGVLSSRVNLLISTGIKPSQIAIPLFSGVVYEELLQKQGSYWSLGFFGCSSGSYHLLGLSLFITTHKHDLVVVFSVTHPFGIRVCTLE